MKTQTRTTSASTRERARIETIRKKYKSKPTPAEILASSDYDEPVNMATKWAMMRAAAHLKALRESSKLTIRALATKTGMTPAALSRLENGVFENATVRSLNKYAIAFGQHVEFSFKNSSELASILERATSLPTKLRDKVEQRRPARARSSKTKKHTKTSQ